MQKEIIIRGARQNNLKNIDLNIPRNKLVVFTGVSGSGKTTLAFDTIFAEGQRRYIESLSSYARQFLGQMQKPDVDKIEGLSPTISIDQKTTSSNPRSTVGTVTEIYDYMRLLFARVGTPHCPKCGCEINVQSIDQIVESIISKIPVGEKLMILSPLIRGKKGEYTKLFADLLKEGYVRVDVDGEIKQLDEEIKLDKNKKHNISVVVDRIIMREDLNKRITESVEVSLKLSNGLVAAVTPTNNYLFSNKFACEKCGYSFDEISPRIFSFNSPFGACPECKGLGFTSRIDPELIVKDPQKSIRQGALNVTGWYINNSLFSSNYFEALASKYNFSLDTPYQDLPQEIKDILLFGNSGEELNIDWKTKKFAGSFKGSFEGIVNNLARRYQESTSELLRVK